MQTQLISIQCTIHISVLTTVLGTVLNAVVHQPTNEQYLIIHANNYPLNTHEYALAITNPTFIAIFKLQNESRWSKMVSIKSGKLVKFITTINLPNTLLSEAKH